VDMVGVYSVLISKLIVVHVTAGQIVKRDYSRPSGLRSHDQCYQFSTFFTKCGLR
jgi:hypothetical protein